MNLATFKTEIVSFHKHLDDFLAATNTNAPSVSQQELANVDVILEKAITIREACHDLATELIHQKLISDHDPLIIELWDLTKALEYTRRKYESWVLAKQREEK
jgi:hypothetical protein